MQHECAVCANGPISDFKAEQGTYDMGEGAVTLRQGLAGWSLFVSQHDVPPHQYPTKPQTLRLATASPVAHKHSVCLMATYTKTQIANLSEMFRHFSRVNLPYTRIPPFYPRRVQNDEAGDASRWRCGEVPYVFGETTQVPNTNKYIFNTINEKSMVIS